jgi:FKBP-type peptidyl-prolyl cis-trans isomerase (trigger factor)
MKELATDDNYSYFKERNRAVIEESARLGIIFRDVAMKENLTPSEEEIREQMVILESALKGKVVDVENAR